MKKLIVHLEMVDPQPYNSRAKNKEILEKLAKYNPGFAQINKGADQSQKDKIIHAQRVLYQHLLRVVEFQDNLGKNSSWMKNHLKLIVIYDKGKDKSLDTMLKKVSDTIKFLDIRYSRQEINIAKYLTQCWRHIASVAGVDNYYDIGSDIYGLHRWIIERLKTNESLNYEQTISKFGELKTPESLDELIRTRRSDLGIDIVREQVRFVNRECDIIRRDNLEDNYDPSYDFLLSEARLLHRLSFSAKSYWGLNLAKRKGYEGGPKYSAKRTRLPLSPKEKDPSVYVRASERLRIIKS